MSINTRVLRTYIATPNGLALSNDFQNRLIDWETFFEERLLDRVANAVGKEWNLKFIETPDKSFMVDINVSNENDYLILTGIIDGLIPEVKFKYYKFDYLNGYVRIQ